MNTHKPVLLAEVARAFSYLRSKQRALFVDGTIGLGGHSLIIAAGLKGKNPRILGFDKDPMALKIAEDNLKGQEVDFQLFNMPFEDAKFVLGGLGIRSIDGVLLDLGVSSMQLDQPERGFSFRTDAFLDMRMNPNQEITAAKIINSYPEARLVKLFREYGEERFSGRIAGAIVNFRKQKEIETTSSLTGIVLEVIPKKFRFGKTHPATNVFRALRMEVNQEVSRLESGIRDCVDLLTLGGCLAVISFHSIEDRIVKQTFQKLANPCACPPKQPVCICGLKAEVKILSKIIPLQEEVDENPRSRSAILRIVEKI